MMNWNEPTQKPNHGERVVVLSNRGKTATIGVFDSVEWKDDPCVVCDQTAHDIWWDDVTAWIYAPGEAVAVSLEQRINAIIESHQKELVAITHGISTSQAFDVDYLRGREKAEMGIIRDLKKAVKAAVEVSTHEDFTLDDFLEILEGEDVFFNPLNTLSGGSGEN